jgi:hypothetical protein
LVNKEAVDFKQRELIARSPAIKGNVDLATSGFQMLRHCPFRPIVDRSQSSSEDRGGRDLAFIHWVDELNQSAEMLTLDYSEREIVVCYPVNEQLFECAEFESPQDSGKDALVGRGCSHSEVFSQSLSAASRRLVFPSWILQN